MMVSLKKKSKSKLDPSKLNQRDQIPCRSRIRLQKIPSFLLQLGQLQRHHQQQRHQRQHHQIIPDPIVVIKDLTSHPERALAKSPGQNGSTETPAALTMVEMLSALISMSES